jgi:hypothetical protein
MDATAVGKYISVAWKSYWKYGQSCEKCSILLALSFPFSYNFPMFLLHFNVYRIGHPKNGGNTFLQNTNTHLQHSTETEKKTIN